MNVAHAGTLIRTFRCHYPLRSMTATQPHNNRIFPKFTSYHFMTLYHSFLFQRTRQGHAIILYCSVVRDCHPGILIYCVADLEGKTQP